MKKKDDLTLWDSGLSSRNIIFHTKDFPALIELKSNGDIYVKGKLIEKDKELVDGLREWLAGVRSENSDNLD
jgi:hypothetical protein